MNEINLDRRKHRGQALVWFLAFIAASSAVLYGVYNVGQITSAKQKVVNATDASALAGANEQARLLNFMAYGNRAMIASDVMVAQMVSLDSWLRWLTQTSRNASYIPYIGYIFNGIYQMINPVEVGVSNSLPVIFNGFDIFKDATQISNEAAYQSGGLLTNSAANGVLAANRTIFGERTDQAPRRPNRMIAGATIGFNEMSWINFTQTYSDNRRGRTAQVVSDSRDEFSIRRDGNDLTNFGVGLVSLRKRGVTLLRDYDRWEAQDTIELRTRRPFRSTSVLPIGWGRADSGDGGHLRIGNEAIHQLAFSSRIDYSWSGISSVRDLSSQDTTQQLHFVQIASKPQNSSMSTNSIGIAPDHHPSVVGSANMSEHLLGGQITAISAARVYFARPQRGVNDWTADAWAGNSTLMRQDRVKEYSSLYNPFWQASLTQVDNTARSALLAALGAPSLATGNILNSIP